MTVHVWSAGSLEARTGGTLYNVRLARALGRRVDVQISGIEGDWPFPNGPVALPSLESTDALVADGLLWTGLHERGFRPPCPTVVVVHMALHQGGEPALRSREEAALADVGVVVTGPPEDCGLDVDPTWIRPGISPVRRSEAFEKRVLTVGRVDDHKDVLSLVPLFASLPSDWGWDIAGDVRSHPEYAARVRSAVEDFGRRVTVHGQLEQASLEALYRRASVMLHGSRSETYGMALQEAVAHGVPLVTRPAGVIRDLPPGAFEVYRDRDEGIAALSRVVGDLGRYRTAARSAAFPTWADAAAQLVGVLTECGWRG